MLLLFQKKITAIVQETRIHPTHTKRIKGLKVRKVKCRNSRYPQKVTTSHQQTVIK